MSQYLPKPYEPFVGDINVNVDLFNYATKTDLKSVPHVDVSSFALKSNFASLETEVDKLNIDKLVPIPVDLSKLTDVVKNDVVKKTEYNKLVTKVDNIDTTNFVSRTKYEKDGSGFEDKISKVGKKIPNVSDLVKKKTDFKAKITEVENKILDVSSLITKTNFNTKITEIECRIPDVSSLITKTNFDVRITTIEGKIPDVSSLIIRTDFDAKLKAISDRVTKNKSKHLLVENELKKVKQN